MCILFDTFRNVIQIRNRWFSLSLEGLWYNSKKPDQYEKKTSENLGLRETRRRRERARAVPRQKRGEQRPVRTDPQ